VVGRVIPENLEREYQENLLQKEIKQNSMRRDFGLFKAAFPERGVTGDLKKRSNPAVLKRGGDKIWGDALLMYLHEKEEKTSGER